MSRKKICHMTSVHPRYDTRIYQKQLKSLSKLNAEISLIVADDRGDEMTDDGIHIFDVGKPNGRLKRFLTSGKLVFKKALEIDADIYQFHDPELLSVGTKLIRKGKKVIYDSHEDVPRQILSKPYLKSFLKPFISWMFESYERRKASKMTYIISATDFITDRFLKFNSNSSTIKNYPIIDELKVDIDWSVKDNSVCYVGAIDIVRGIREMTEAVKLSKAGFKLAGKFGSDALQSEILSKLDDKTTFYGFADRKLVKEIFLSSKAGLVTLHPTVNYKDALPVKMFEYMLAGIPVITSNIPLWKEIVLNADCGIAVDPMNPDDIAKAIDIIVSDDELAEKMGRNGQKAVLELYNWKNEEEKLLEIYSFL